MPRSLEAALPAPEASSPGLPAEHFGAALAYYACGAVGLVWVAPDLAGGAFHLPRVVAVVHLFTLGWIVLSIFGALCQFLPVAVGRPMRSRVAAHVAFGAQTIGVGCFVLALLGGSRGLLHAGAGALAIAFLTFAINLVSTLSPVTDRSLTWWALAGSAVFLVLTPAYGVLLALGLHDGSLVADRFAVVAQHAHIAIVGFVLLVMVGVAHRLLPMFLLSHGGSERPAWLAVGFLFASAALLSVPVTSGARLAIAGALGSAGVVAFIVQAATFYRHRKRRTIDVGMRLAGAGVIALAAAVLLAPLALGRGLADLRLLTTYFVVLLGAVTLFIAGHYYKIVPFIVWYHRFGPFVGKRKVPKVSELFSNRVATIDAALLSLGWLGLATSTLLGAPLLARASAVVFAGGALLQAVVVAQIARRRLA
ncbi:MAG: hypothetical protein HYV09_25960 [Deltaproteobacteria bacterium]|nr:hypothetical protein [Deltaproteobacteria bacterium]